ncbi:MULTISPECIES: hypothetical protein [unclassified Leucobacter]|uniref:hypothetical protein n=1 Tax=unclassified Leucobacter TaxID=2621730 RepID=UPI003017FD4B
MAYWDQADLADDGDLRRRVTACAAMEGVPDPDGWAYQNRWVLSAQPGWVEAYAYARSAGTGAAGRDPAVVTDGMILAAVQSLTGGDGSGV